MILLATIFRVIDGLPLSATTDILQRRDINDCQKYVKLVSKKLFQLPDRCTLDLKKFNIHLISSSDMSFIVLVEDSYSTLLAFSFLTEIQKEFLQRYDRVIIEGIKRPYALIEFDMYLQQTKQRYNSPRTMSTRLDLPALNEEMKHRPPYQIQEADLYVGIHGGYYGNGNVTHDAMRAEYRPPVAVSATLSPLPWQGWLSAAINVFCALLSLMRGMVIISHGHVDDEDSGAYRYGTCFLIASCLAVYQIYLMFRSHRRRVILYTSSFLALAMCHLYLYHLRNPTQVAFHLAASILATYVVASRQTNSKLPGYNV